MQRMWLRGRSRGKGRKIRRGGGGAREFRLQETHHVRMGEAASELCFLNWQVIVLRNIPSGFVHFDRNF